MRRIQGRICLYLPHRKRKSSYLPTEAVQAVQAVERSAAAEQAVRRQADCPVAVEAAVAADCCSVGSADSRRGYYRLHSYPCPYP